jgi:hypothetical protein
MDVADEIVSLSLCNRSSLRLASAPSLVLVTPAITTGSIARRDRRGFVGKKYPVLLISVAGCNRPDGRSAVQLAVNLHSAISAEATRNAA